MYFAIVKMKQRQEGTHAYHSYKLNMRLKSCISYMALLSTLLTIICKYSCTHAVYIILFKSNEKNRQHGFVAFITEDARISLNIDKHVNT